MNASRRAIVAILTSAVAASFALHTARASGPDYQTLNDAPGAGAPVATLNDVAFLSGPQFIGSGTVIGVKTVGNTSTLAILTANHVASSPGGINTIGFGANGNVLTGAVNANWQGFRISNIGMEDIAIMQATITKPAVAGQALNVYNSIIGNVPNLATDFASDYDSVALTSYEMLPPPTISDGFSQYGYGSGGVYTDNVNLPSPPAAAGAQGNGYVQTPDNPSGVRRFQNNTVNNIAVAGPVVVGGPNGNTTYFQPMVYNNALDPSTGGTGMGTQGDSGSALFTSTPGGNVSVTPTGDATNIMGLGAGAINVPLNDTNNASAVFVSVAGSGLTLGAPPNQNPFYLTSTVNPYPQAIDGSVPLLPTGPVTYDGDSTYGTYNWAAYYAANPALISVPEPTSLSLLAIGGMTLLGRRRNLARQA